jgi:N,N-dimethylformamidase beta subunit-like, C-terminal
MDIYPLRAIPVLALILCLISGSIVIINPNNYKPALAQQQEQEQQENKQSALSIVGSMRENNHNLTATNRPPLNAKSTYYTFTKNRSEVSTPENNSHTNEFGKGTRIALINPTFTSAAYNNSFYVFYEKHFNTLPGVNVTSDRDLLSSTVINNKKELSSSVSSMIYLLKNIKWVTSQPNITLVTDEDVDKGIIFEKNNSSSNDIAKTNSSSNSDNHINVYDIIILGHQEYVTQKEYDNLKQFVRSGGTMIILDGNVFYAEVRYDKNTQTVTLVKGHSWAFNGISAWRSVPERWAKETSEWVGSNYLCYSCNIRFTNDPFEYIHHEEQHITNPHDIILMNYNASLSDYPIQTRPVIATYELNYQKGRVIALGIYSDDVLSNGRFDRFFDNLLLQYSSKVID